MSFGLAYWIIMLVWLLFGVGLHFGWVGSTYSGAGTLMLFLLFGLLGWQVFGAPLKRG